MKNIILTFVVLFFVVSCNKDAEIKTSNNEIYSYIYKPSTNKFDNKEFNIVFNSDELSENSFNNLKENIITKYLKCDLQNVKCITMYFDDSLIGSKNKVYKESNILGISVYYENKNNELEHSFYKKENNNYEKKFTYLENITASSSQIFILSYYFPKVFIKKTLGINNITCVNSNFTKYLNQRNEFELFKAVSLFPLKKSIFSKEIEQVVSLADPKTCAGCEGGDGECDASGNYCGEDPICESKKIKSEVVTLGLISKVTSETLFNESLYYNLRDKLMAKHNKGKKYIKYYYAISRFNNVSDYKLKTLYKMITTLPDFNSSIERLVNKTNNDDEIIIDTQLKINLLSIIADLKLHSSNENYQNIMSDLENDIVFISNKSKTTVLNELQ